MGPARPLRAAVRCPVPVPMSSTRLPEGIQGAKRGRIRRARLRAAAPITAESTALRRAACTMDCCVLLPRSGIPRLAQGRTLLMNPAGEGDQVPAQGGRVGPFGREIAAESSSLFAEMAESGCEPAKTGQQMPD